MNTKLLATALAIVAMLVAGPAAANASDRADVGEIVIKRLGPNKCQYSDTHVVGGPWSESCTGVDSNGCVGSWSNSGTHDANLTHVTTASSGDVVCPDFAKVKTFVQTDAEVARADAVQ